MSRQLKEPYHVVPVGDDWGIKLLTSTRVIEKYSTYQQAETRAVALMRKNNRPLVLKTSRTGRTTTAAVNTAYLGNIARLP